MERVAALCDAAENPVPGTHILYNTCIFHSIHCCTDFVFWGQGSYLLWPIADTWDIRKTSNILTGGFVFSPSHPFVLPDSHKLISGCQPAQNISICQKAYFSKVIESGMVLFKVWGFFSALIASLAF